MSTDSALPPPVARLDAEALVEAVNRAAGADLRMVGRADHGEVGAAYLEWPDGEPGVLTGSGATYTELAQTQRVLAQASVAGLLVPEYRLVADLGEKRAIVQTRLPGTPPAVVTDETVTQMMTFLDQAAGLGGGAPPLDLYLTSSGPGFCLHETLERHSSRTRGLLTRIREIGADGRSEDGRDLVHLDFHCGNILVDQTGRLTGVVDWDGYGRGDRRLALVTFFFDLAHSRRFRPDRYLVTDSGGILDRLAEANPEDVRRWWAHMSLRQVDWTIRHDHPPAEVEHYLDFTERGLDQLEHGSIGEETLRVGA